MKILRYIIALLALSISFSCSKPSGVEPTATLSSTSVETVIRQPLATITITLQQTAQSPFPSSTLRFIPTVSPNFGEQNVIAFTGVGNNPSDADIYLVNVNNQDMMNLTQNPSIDEMPAWSPDGTRIAFLSNRDSNNMQLYLMNADGSGVQQITNSDLRLLHRPSWSPDGKSIIFDALKPDNTDGIFIVDLNSRETTTLINEPAHNLGPDWSPGGNQIVFFSDREGPTEGDFHIYIIDLTSMEIRRLTNDAALDSSPAWSLDGEHIAFSRDTGKRAPFICIIKPDGSDLKMLLPGNTEMGGNSPSWSGDGKMIAFYDLRPIENGPILEWINSVFLDSIFVMNSDGSGTVRLTFGNVLAQYPDWRP